MTARNPPSAKLPLRVGIVGGGLAGLAAASVLAEHGATVELFEARRQLGGRAGSYRDPETGQTVDHCQHVGMGCCTYWLDFCRRTGIDGLFRRHGTLHFFGPDGRRCEFSATPWLPAPLHLLPALLRMNYLSFGERMGIARTLMRLARLRVERRDEGPTIGDWLAGQGQSEKMVQRFWSVVLVSALGETVARASLSAARKVFLDGFLSHRRAYEVLVPTMPLTKIHDRQVADWLHGRGATIHRGATVTQLLTTPGRSTGICLADGSCREFDHVVLAVAWRQVSKLLPPAIGDRLPYLDDLEKIESCPIAGIHLWFDRPITDLAHAVFVGRLSQWLFNHGPQAAAREEHAPSHYVQVVISGDRQLDQRSRQHVVDEVLADLRTCFPSLAGARLLRWQLVNQPHAVFSVRPGIDSLRPPQATAVPGLHLAGDWTRTDWPATMEGAVRSGYLAAESVLSETGQLTPCRVADLPRGVVARLLLGSTVE